MRFNVFHFVLVAVLGMIIGCTPTDVPTKAVAILDPKSGSNVSGVVLFTQVGDKVKVVADFSGLTPNSQHGFHVHQFGDLTAANGSSAGGHYNPEGHAHDLPPNPKRHAGSFGNVQADENGFAHFEMLDDTISVAGKKNPIIGRSVVIHAKADDGGQPAGNAGPRIGVGVIGIRK